MKVKQGLLIEDLLYVTDRAISTVTGFRELSEKELNAKSDPSRWSILECLEHLNLCGDFYLPEMEKQLLQGARVNENKIFNSGVIGNYFANWITRQHGTPAAKKKL